MIHDIAAARDAALARAAEIASLDELNSVSSELLGKKGALGSL
ncbi:MAG: hypothetical protein JWL70_1276, partial [Acidimicrobiia bacterium]|nr:hypothetical protein [Acidimicrobiia bacterium]